MPGEATQENHVGRMVLSQNRFYLGYKLAGDAGHSAGFWGKSGNSLGRHPYPLRVGIAYISAKPLSTEDNY